MDMKEMVKLQDVTLDVKDTNNEIEKQFGFGEQSSSGCSSNDIMIRNNISAIQKENIGVCTDNYDFGL
jgi:hypothetical protein